MCDCDRALELISLRLDGGLTPDEGRELDEHLEHCDACRSLAQDLAGLHAAMRSEEEVPAGFHQAVMDRVRESKVVPLAPRRRRQWKSWAAMAAVFAVVLIGAQGLPDLLFRAGGASTAPAAAPRTAMQDAAGTPAAAADDKGADAPEMFSVGGDEPAQDYSAPLEKDAAETGRSQDSGAGEAATPAPAETAQAQVTGGTEPPQVSLAQIPSEGTAAPETAQDQERPQPKLFTALPGPEGTAPTELTKEEALDKLLEGRPVPEAAQRVETEDFFGYELFTNTLDSGQVITGKLAYNGLSQNGKCHLFRIYEDIVDDPETGEGHQAICNTYAVPLDGSAVVAELPEDPEGEQYSQETSDAYDASLEAFRAATQD